MNQETGHNRRSLAALLAEGKEEFRQFWATRIAMFKAESREKLAVLKVAARVAVVAGVLLATSFLMFTLAVAGFVVAFLNGNPFRWCIAFFCVGVLWAVAGGMFAHIAKRAFKSGGLIPKQTLAVLREDRIWIQSEARSRI